MSKGHMLKTLVNDRLTAAGEEIFELFGCTIKESQEAAKGDVLKIIMSERLAAAAEEIYEWFGSTIKEYEDELRAAKEEAQKKQRLLDYLCPRVQATRTQKVQIPATVSSPDPGPDLGLSQETTEIPKIKEEPVEQSIKKDEELLPVSIPEPAVGVKTEEFIPLHQEKNELQEEALTSSEPHFLLETEGQPNHSSQTDNNDDLGSVSCAPAHTEDNEDNSHQALVRDRSTGNSSLIKSLWATRYKKYNCTVCSKTFSNLRSQYLHMQIHKEENPFNCSFCGKEFTDKWIRIRHERLHTGVKPFSCTLCKKAFTYSHHLHSHLRTHTKEKPYSCLVCNKEYAHERGHKNHMKLHTGEGLHSCPICKKTFTCKAVLEVHMRVHSGERPFRCSLCEKSFKYKCNLKTHHISHHTERKPCSSSVVKKPLTEISQEEDMKKCTKEKPYSCPLCKKKFSEKRGQKQHMWIHTGEKLFSCPICKKKFSQKSHQNEHMRIHTGEKAFSCTVCMKAFTFKSSLRAHMPTHTKEKPFSCPICKKTFARKNTQKEHVKKMHSREKDCTSQTNYASCSTTAVEDFKQFETI